MKQFLKFMDQLQRNNNKEWFDAHKAEYKELRAMHLEFTEKLISGIAEFDDSVRGLTPKDCTYRIYRDLRFSKDKRPYKQHIGTFICPGGKKSQHCGYYFHLEPNVGHFLVTGLYLPDSKIQKSVREEIMLNGKNLVKTIKSAKGFYLDKSDMLRNVPTGFSKDDPYAELYKLKNFILQKDIDDDYIASPNLLENLIRDFRETYDFCRILNRAVDFVLDSDAESDYPKNL